MSDIREQYYKPLHTQEKQNNQSTLPFRMLLAALLFSILILFDKSNTKTAETAIEKFSQAISADVEDKLEEWVNKNIHLSSN